MTQDANEDLNFCKYSGKLVEDVVLKFSEKSNTNYIRFTILNRIKVGRTFKTQFLSFAAFGALADELDQKSLKKNDPIQVEARSMKEKWTDKTGKTVETTNYVITNFKVDDTRIPPQPQSMEDDLFL